MSPLLFPRRMGRIWFSQCWSSVKPVMYGCRPSSLRSSLPPSTLLLHPRPHLTCSSLVATHLLAAPSVLSIRGANALHFSSKSENSSKDTSKDSSSSSSNSCSDKGIASNGDKIQEDSLNRVYTIPNMITLSRILLCPFLYYAIEQDMKTVALGGVVYCAFTDWLDGYIAKKFNSSSRFGAFIDPLADKIFIATMSIGLAAQNIVPYPLVALIVLRDVVLFSGTFYLRLKHKPPDAPIFDTSATATFEIIPSTLSKINTLCQFSCIILGMSKFTLGFPLIEQLEPLFWLTAGTTLASGISYMDGSGMANNSRSTSKAKRLFNFFGDK